MTDARGAPETEPYTSESLATSACVDHLSLSRSLSVSARVRVEDEVRSPAAPSPSVADKKFCASPVAPVVSLNIVTPFVCIIEAQRRVQWPSSDCVAISPVPAGLRSMVLLLPLLPPRFAPVFMKQRQQHRNSCCVSHEVVERGGTHALEGGHSRHLGAADKTSTQAHVCPMLHQ